MTEQHYKGYTIVLEDKSTRSTKHRIGIYKWGKHLQTVTTSHRNYINFAKWVIDFWEEGETAKLYEECYGPIKKSLKS